MSIVDIPIIRRVLTSSVVDSLTAPHGVDTYLGLVDPGLAVHQVRGRVIEIAHGTPTTATITLAVNAVWGGHVAGQFVRVGANVDGCTHTRCYSIESPPSDSGATTISFSVGEVAGGTLSPHLVHDLRVGDVLRLSQAEGSFTLPETLPEHLVMLGAGTGITPLVGMIRTLCDTRMIDDTEVTLIAYAASPRDQLHRDELLALADSYATLRVRFGCTDMPGAGDLDGLFGVDHLETAAPKWRDATMFACGAPPFMSAVVDATEAHGRLDRLRTEAFAPLLVAAPSDDATTGTIHFTTSGRRAEDVTGSILEAAEAQGLRPAHGCRMGICHTCTRPKVAGCVRNLVSGELSGPEPASIQICVSVPVGDVIVDL